MAQHDLHGLLEQAIGAEGADALMQRLPPDAADLATKTDVAQLRAETKAEFAQVRAETKAEFAQVRAEMATKADMAILGANIRTDIANLGSELRREATANMRVLFFSMAAMIGSATAAVATLGH